MHSYIEGLKLALLSIMGNGLRSFLTTLGITIGVASVIAVVAIGQGMSQSIITQFEDFGSNTITVRSYTSTEDKMQGRWNKLPLSDVDLIKQRITGIEDITPTTFVGEGYSPISFKGRESYSRLIGTTSKYQDANRVYPVQGRFITPSDELSKRKVVVIAQDVVENLKLPSRAVGSHIIIEGEWFKVVGVMESRGEIFGFSQDDYVVIPFSTAKSLIGWSKEPDVTISFKPSTPESLEQIIVRTRHLLRRAHGLKPGEAENFTIETSDQLKESFSSITDTVTIVLGGIVGISLLVGGIGIMNIMLVSVTERTKEIGIAKALGARRDQILTQFLLEAVMLSLLGGTVGVLLGFGIGQLISVIFPFLPGVTVPLWAIILSLGFSITVGLLFGIAPAAKAAKLDPICALRHE